MQLIPKVPGKLLAFLLPVLVKETAKFSMNLIKKGHTLKICGKREMYLYDLLTSALDGGEWPPSRKGRFSSWGKDLRYSIDRSLDGPLSRSGQCVVEN
jgi:hypothetical protein